MLYAYSNMTESELGTQPYQRGHGGRVVTLSPPTSEARVRFPAQPQMGATGSCLLLVGSL